MKKIENIMIIVIIGKKEKKLNLSRENYYPFGDSVIRKRKSMSLQSVGIQGIKIYLPSLLVAMIFQNKKLDKS